MDVYLNLGSNIGDSEAIIRRAVAIILSTLHPTQHRVSEPFRSKSWGYLSENEFINVGVGLRLSQDIDPFELLHILQAIEFEFNVSPHRNYDGSYADRELDIDIIEIPGIELNTPALTLPHPRAHLRPFVKIPRQHSQLPPIKNQD